MTTLLVTQLNWVFTHTLFRRSKAPGARRSEAVEAISSVAHMQDALERVASEPDVQFEFSTSERSPKVTVVAHDANYSSTYISGGQHRVLDRDVCSLSEQDQGARFLAEWVARCLAHNNPSFSRVALRRFTARAHATAFDFFGPTAQPEWVDAKLKIGPAAFDAHVRDNDVLVFHHTPSVLSVPVEQFMDGDDWSLLPHLRQVLDELGKIFTPVDIAEWLFGGLPSSQRTPATELRRPEVDVRVVIADAHRHFKQLATT